jgi:hypothetical protein
MYLACASDANVPRVQTSRLGSPLVSAALPHRGEQPLCSAPEHQDRNQKNDQPVGRAGRCGDSEREGAGAHEQDVCEKRRRWPSAVHIRSLTRLSACVDWVIPVGAAQVRAMSPAPAFRTTPELPIDRP